MRSEISKHHQEKKKSNFLQLPSTGCWANDLTVRSTGTSSWYFQKRSVAINYKKAGAFFK